MPSFQTVKQLLRKYFVAIFLILLHLFVVAKGYIVRQRGPGEFSDVICELMSHLSSGDQRNHGNYFNARNRALEVTRVPVQLPRGVFEEGRDKSWRRTVYEVNIPMLCTVM